MNFKAKKETKEKRFKKMGSRGITLISLVITIIILLILAGISILSLTGENGILSQITISKERTIKGKELEQIKLAYTAAKVGNLGDAVSEIDLKNELEKYTGEDKIEIINNGDGTLNIKFLDTNNHYTVENDDIKATEAKITNKKIILNSTNGVTFVETISQEDVNQIVGKEKASYEILGISAEENGEYSTTATGKFGILEIQGDIKNATFKYSLTNFMQGDETFFVKYSIEGSETKFQKLEIIQGDKVKYEEDFIGIIYESEEGQEQWEILENENFSNGKCLKIVDLPISEAIPKIKFDFIGSKIGIILAGNKEEGGSLFSYKIVDINGNTKVNRPVILDPIEEMEYNMIVTSELGSSEKYSFELKMVPSRDWSEWSPGDKEKPPILTSYLYFDGIIIYK